MKDIDKITRAFDDVIWMAIRYANGRKTYAPSMVRDAIRLFKEVYPEWNPHTDDTLKEDMIRSGATEDCGNWLCDLVEERP